MNKFIEILQGISVLIAAVSFSTLCLSFAYVVVKETMTPQEPLICPKSCHDKRK